MTHLPIILKINAQYNDNIKAHKFCTKANPKLTKRGQAKLEMNIEVKWFKNSVQWHMTHSLCIPLEKIVYSSLFSID